MDPLPAPDNRHLLAAQGWLELGLPLEAEKELDEITPELRARPDVLHVRFEVYFGAKQWEGVIVLGDTLVQMLPKEPQFWIQRSFALHELTRTREAFNKLVPASNKFPKVWMIPYNLACYCAQLGRLEECKAWFQKAMTIDGRTVHCKAIDDPDLKPLWDSMSGTFWERTQ